MVHEAAIAVAGSGERRLDDLGRPVAGQAEFDQAVKVVEDLWVAEDGGTPVGIDAALQFGMSFGDLALQVVDVHVVYRWVARVLHVDAVVGQRVEIGGVGGFAGRGQLRELVQNVAAGVLNDPFPVTITWPSACVFPLQTNMETHRVWAIFSSMARDSACLTAICKRSDSQGHSGFGGALQIAQLGCVPASISTRKGRDLCWHRYRSFRWALAGRGRAEEVSGCAEGHCGSSGEAGCRGGCCGMGGTRVRGVEVAQPPGKASCGALKQTWVQGEAVTKYMIPHAVARVGRRALADFAAYGMVHVRTAGRCVGDALARQRLITTALLALPCPPSPPRVQRSGVAIVSSSSASLPVLHDDN